MVTSNPRRARQAPRQAADARANDQHTQAGADGIRAIASVLGRMTTHSTHGPDRPDSHDRVLCPAGLGREAVPQAHPMPVLSVETRPTRRIASDQLQNSFYHGPAVDAAPRSSSGRAPPSGRRRRYGRPVSTGSTRCVVSLSCVSAIVPAPPPRWESPRRSDRAPCR